MQKGGKPAQPGPSDEGAGATPVALTRADVERLIDLLPQVARLGAQHSHKAEREGDSSGKPSAEMREIEKLLASRGLTVPEFAAQMATLVSTYLVLSPEALDQQIPNENSPEVQRVLRDPSVSQEDKQALREQLRIAQQNKEAIRAELEQMVTEDNKRVVKPLLLKVKAALDAAQAEASKAHPTGE